MTTTLEQPSKTCLEKARRLARDAAKNDNWMEAVVEEAKEYDDYGEFTQRHQERWEETCHFDHYYRTQLEELAHGQNRQYQRKTGVVLAWEGWYYAFFLPLKEAFWEEWEEKVGLYKKWEEARK